MKKLLSFLLIFALCITMLVSCDFGFGDNDDDRSDKNNKADKDNSAVKAYVYDYDDISELENADSPAKLDEKKWKSASKFDLSQQWGLGSSITDKAGEVSGNICKIENTSALAMSFDLSFTVKGTPSYMASYINLDMVLMDGNGNIIAEQFSNAFSSLSDGKIFFSGSIPAKETYYLAIQRRSFSLNVGQLPSEDVTDYYDAYPKEEHDHHYDVTETYYDYSGGVKYEGSFSYNDIVNIEDVTYIYIGGDNVEYSSDGYIIIGGIGGSFGNIEYVTGDYEYFTGKIEYVTGDYEHIIGGGNIIIGGSSAGTIINGSVSSALGAQVYLNCKSRKVSAEEDSFGNPYDPTPDYGYDETNNATNNGYADSDYEFDIIDYEGRYETMYVNAPDGHQVTAFDKYGDTMSIAHGAEVVRIGYGGYWSKIELYGMVRFIPSEYLSYEMPGWVETDVETDYEYPSYEIANPGAYYYEDRYETVYVNNPDSEVTLRSANYASMGSLPHGTEIIRTGVSTDSANYWSKILYNDNTYYIASKFITTMQNPEEGFVDVDKTVYISPKTGSLNIRNIPSMEGAIVGHAVSGVGIKVVAEHTQNGWYMIEFINADGVIEYGYIASDAKYYE